MGQALDVVLGPHRFLYVDHPELRPLKAQFDALQLSTHEIGQLYDKFLSIDSDRSGSVSVRELFAHLATEATYFRDRVFTLFDDDGSGKIDFREFVLSLWNYCTLSKASLVMFAFDLYDTDSTGELSPEEIEGMLRDLYGKQAQTHQQAKQIMKELRSLDKKATINVDRFRAFVTNHPALLFPAFQMQLALRQHVLGVRFWERCAQKRIKLVDGRRVTLGKLLEMNVHEDAYLSVLEAHEQVVQEEKQAKMAAYQQSRYANKHPQQAANLTASQKVRAKSIIDWIGLKRQFSALKDDAGHLSSQKYATASRDDPFVENDPRHGAGAASKPAHGKVHPQHEGNANSHLLHPHDEMALLVLQVTGTHHYRRIWTQHHLKGSPSTAAPPSAAASVQTATNSLDHEDGEGPTTRKRKTHRIAPELSAAAAATPPPSAGPVIGGPASSLPVFVAPPLLSLSSPATAVASADAGNDGNDEGDSSKAANNLSGPPSTQLYQMLLQGDALQRQHKFVELGNDPNAAKKKKAQAANTPTDETDASSSAHASPNNAPRPAVASESAASTPSKSHVQKTATTLMDLSTATPPPTNSRNRKEILQWQAKVVEQSGILQHVAALQQHSGAISPSPGSARRGSDPLVSHSSHDPPSGRRSSNPHPHAHHSHGHHKHGAAGHGGVRLIGALAGDDVVSPRVAILQHQLHQQHAHLQAQQQQAVLEDYLGPGGSRHGSRRSSLQK